MKSNKYIYLCGPTVYNKVHIGNMRPIVTFDLILRAMKYKNKNIKLIHNITDIDDKIVNKAKEEKISEEEIAKKYTDFYLEMLEKYNIETIDFMPKVSEKINVIDSFISKLNEKGFVYESNNSYYFKTLNVKEYGEVSNNSLDDLKSEDDNKEKENSFDFALWKNKTEGKTWDTSLGKGRPGWHTECAAFIYELTNNESLLIHGGGIDLKFPHHENENAQFRAITSKPICEQWLHVGIINYKNQKMSKSLGNIVLADQFLDRYNGQTEPGDLFRLLILSSSIKSIIELSDEMIDSLIKKNNQIDKIVNFVLLNRLETKAFDNDEIIEELAQGKFSSVYKYLNSLIRDFNSTKDIEVAKEIFSFVSFLGFNSPKKIISDHLIDTYKNWQQELKNKNYEKADSLRNILLSEKLI